MTNGAIAYNDTELAFLRENHELPRKILAERFNQAFNRELSWRTLAKKLWRMGLKKYDGHGYINKTSFKKGRRPHNDAPLGTERVRTDGTVVVKVSFSAERKRRWKARSILVWEKFYGENSIPDGSVIIHINGNKQDDRIENLKCVTRKERLYLNGQQYCQCPAPLKAPVEALALLRAKAKMRAF